jgi:hypothetical protein
MICATPASVGLLCFGNPVNQLPVDRLQFLPRQIRIEPTQLAATPGFLKFLLSDFD